MKLMIDIDEDIYTRLYDNGMEAFDVNEDGVRDLRKILTSIRKGTPIYETNNRVYFKTNNGNYKIIKGGKL